VTIAASLDLGTLLVGFLPTIKILLVFFAIVLIFTILPTLIGRHLRKRRNQQWLGRGKSLQEIQRLKPVQFEQLVAGLFQMLGYKTATTKGSYDGGVDVIAVKDGRRHLIQCKKFKTQKVSVEMLREFYGVLADKLSSAKGYFISTGTFALEAEKYAQDKPIELIDGARQVEYMKLAGFEGRPSVHGRANRERFLWG
jgi:restriction system protein